MSDYTRTSRECAPAQLKPELLQAIRAYAQQHDLGSVEAGARLCCETHSEKKKKGLLAALGGGDPDPAHDTALLLTPAWLIWARSGPKSGVVVSSARLHDAQISVYSSKLIADTGLEVQSPRVGSPEPVVAFIPLSADLVQNQRSYLGHPVGADLCVCPGRQGRTRRCAPTDHPTTLFDPALAASITERVKASAAAARR